MPFAQGFGADHTGGFGHVLIVDARRTRRSVLFHDKNRCLSHCFIEAIRHRAAADCAALIFDHNSLPRHEHRERLREVILEGRLTRLRVAKRAERRAAVPRNTFQIECALELTNDLGFAAAGAAADDDDGKRLRRGIEHIEALIAKRLVAAFDALQMNTGFGQPAGGNLRPQAAARAADLSIRRMRCEFAPRCHTACFDLARHKRVPKCDSGVPPFFFVADADKSAFLVAQDR